MTEGELKKLLRELGGWGLIYRSRRKTEKQYAYARRREGKKVVTKYLCPEDQIETLERETVEQKLISDAR